MSTADALREIRRATRAHGVTTTDALQLSQRQIDRYCSAGVLERRHIGVFVNPAVPRTELQDLAVAVAAGGRMAAAWGRSAAALWGLRDEFPDTPEIVVPRRRVAKVHGAVVHRSSDLCWDHITHRMHIRVTNPLITTLDLGVVLSPIEVAEVIIRGRQLKLYEPAAIRATVARLSRPGRTGLRVVRAALDLVLVGDRPADSVLELRFALLADRHALPKFEYQYRVRIRGRVLYIDFAYPEIKLAIEVDGYEKRASRESLDYDDQRANLLVLDGWTILRFTWHRVVRDPGGVAIEVLATLGSLGYRLGG